MITSWSRWPVGAQTVLVGRPGRYWDSLRIPKLRVRGELVVCELYENLSVHHFDFVGGCWLCGRHSQGFARSYVEFGAVTWADETEVFEGAFAQWTSIVCALIVYAVDFVLDANQDDKSIINLKAKLVGLGEVGKQGNRDEVAHGIFRFE